MFVPVTHVVSAVIGEACPGQLYWREGGVGCVLRFVGGGSNLVGRGLRSVFGVLFSFVRVLGAGVEIGFSVKQMLSRQVMVDKIQVGVTSPLL